MKNVCPVCGYDALRRPPTDYSICPCCRTEYGVSDYSWSHAELRHIWIEHGAIWGSKRVAEPVGWNPVQQLENIGYSCTDADLKRLECAESNLEEAPFPLHPVT